MALAQHSGPSPTLASSLLLIMLLAVNEQGRKVYRGEGGRLYPSNSLGRDEICPKAVREEMCISLRRRYRALRDVVGDLARHRSGQKGWPACEPIMKIVGVMVCAYQPDISSLEPVAESQRSDKRLDLRLDLRLSELIMACTSRTVQYMRMASESSYMDYAA